MSNETFIWLSALTARFALVSVAPLRGRDLVDYI